MCTILKEVLLSELCRHSSLWQDLKLLESCVPAKFIMTYEGTFPMHATFLESTSFGIPCMHSILKYFSFPHSTVTDRMKPISVTSFRDHVQQMHAERDRGFEIEYKV